MKGSTKFKVRQCWEDMQYAINAAHAKTHGLDSWVEFLEHSRTDFNTCEGLMYGGYRVLTTLTEHIARMDDRDVREAIRLTIDEIIFCGLWNSETVDRIQAFFVEKMGPFYMDAVGKQGRIQFWEVV